MMKLFFNGHIFQSPNRFVSSLLVENGKVKEIRDREIPSLYFSQAEQIDLDGKWLFPAFADRHTHPGSRCRILAECDARAAKDWNEAREMIADFIARNPDRPHYFVHGWNQATWGDLLQDDLDALTKKPLLIANVSYHGARLNQVAAEAFGVDTHPVEQVYERLAVLTLPKKDDLLRAIPKYQRVLHALGVVEAYDMYLGSMDQIEAYQELDRTNQMFMRTSAFVSPRLLDDPRFSDVLGVSGTRFHLAGLKLLLDGAIGLHTAFVSHPYCDTHSYGTMRYQPHEAAELIKRAMNFGLRTIAVHAIGDAAVSQTLDLYASFARQGTDVSNWRIEHAEMIQLRDIARIKSLGVIPVMQPNFHWDLANYKDRLDEQARQLINPFRSLLDAGVPLIFGSDGLPEGPLIGLDYAMNKAEFPEQRLSLEEALNAYTTSSIQPQQPADFIVLDQNLFQTEKLRDISVLQTYAAGEEIHLS